MDTGTQKPTVPLPPVGTLRPSVTKRRGGSSWTPRSISRRRNCVRVPHRFLAQIRQDCETASARCGLLPSISTSTLGGITDQPSSGVGNSTLKEPACEVPEADRVVEPRQMAVAAELSARTGHRLNQAAARPDGPVGVAYAPDQRASERRVASGRLRSSRLACFSSWLQLGGVQ